MFNDENVFLTTSVLVILYKAEKEKKMTLDRSFKNFKWISSADFEFLVNKEGHKTCKKTRFINATKTVDRRHPGNHRDVEGKIRGIYPRSGDKPRLKAQ